MAFIGNNNPKVGDWVVTTMTHSAMCGTFTKGSRVRVYEVCERGYGIEDEEGHRICEIGWTI